MLMNLFPFPLRDPEEGFHTQGKKGQILKALFFFILLISKLFMESITRSFKHNLCSEADDWLISLISRISSQKLDR